MVAEMGIMHVLINTDFHSLTLTWVRLTLSTRSAYSTIKHLSQIWPLSGSGSQSLWTGDYIGHVICGKEIFCSSWIDSYSEYKLAFPAMILLPKQPAMGIHNALSTIMILRSVLLLTKELISESTQCNSGPMIIGPTGLIILLTILKELV